jgi:hypothetical protein
LPCGFLRVFATTFSAASENGSARGIDKPRGTLVSIQLKY